MTIIAADWSRRVQITEINTSPALSGYVALLTESNLPAEIWTTAINGGGDLRVCLNSDGTGQLPLEVVSFDTVAETAQLWVRFPTFASGDSLWLFYGKAGETQPAVTDTFGRNSVWVDYDSAWHLNTLSDSAGNANDLTIVGTPTLQPDSIIGDAYRFANSGDYLFTDTVGVNGGDSFNSSFWYKRDVGDELPLNAYTYGIADTGNAFNNYAIILAREANVLNVDIFDRNTSVSVERLITIDPVLQGETVYISASQSASGTTLTVIHNGTTYTATGTRRLQGSGLNRLSLNRLMDSSPATGDTSTLDEPRLTSSGVTRSAVYAETEYANQSSPNTFWSTGTPESTGGGGGALTIITSPIVSGEVVGSPTLTAGSVLISPVAIATAEAFGTSIVTQGATFINTVTIPTQEIVDTPVVVPQGVFISPVAIGTQETVNEPTLLEGLVFIYPEKITTEEFFGNTSVESLLKQVFTQKIFSEEDVGRPLVLGGDSIVIPLGDRDTLNKVASHLRALVFKGTANDVIVKWLRSEGFEGQINDAFMAYWSSLGYTGAFNDRWSKWKKD